MILAWFIANKRLAIGGAILAVLLAVILPLTMCHHDNTAEKQAEQTNRSGEAIAAAASGAIETIGNRTVTEQNVDNAVNVATENINNAQDATAVRNAVIAGVCGQSSHRHDPACRVR